MCWLAVSAALGEALSLELPEALLGIVDGSKDAQRAAAAHFLAAHAERPFL